jgi:hypothetical protein
VSVLPGGATASRWFVSLGRANPVRVTLFKLRFNIILLFVPKQFSASDTIMLYVLMMAACVLNVQSLILLDLITATPSGGEHHVLPCPHQTLTADMHIILFRAQTDL